MIKFDENDSNVLLYTDRCCLHYLDKRVSPDTMIIYGSSHLQLICTLLSGIIVKTNTNSMPQGAAGNLRVTFSKYQYRQTILQIFGSLSQSTAV